MNFHHGPVRWPEYMFASFASFAPCCIVPSDRVRTHYGAPNSPSPSRCHCEKRPTDLSLPPIHTRTRLRSFPMTFSPMLHKLKASNLLPIASLKRSARPRQDSIPSVIALGTLCSWLLGRGTSNPRNSALLGPCRSWGTALPTPGILSSWEHVSPSALLAPRPLFCS